jgi:choline dehydrogenase-like flavoprotein
VDADYVVVGTGSAGSVVVNRLSADPGSQVVVLEAGPRDKDKFSHIPLTWAVKLFRSAVDWDYLTEPQKELNGRQIYWPRGKMLGGSSSMNAMMWVRGFAADYDEWGTLAGEEWSFDQVAPYFDRIEAGPLVISPRPCPRSSTAAWLAAVTESGYPVESPNTDVPERFCETMVTQRRGARWSCADAYLSRFFGAGTSHCSPRPPPRGCCSMGHAPSESNSSTAVSGGWSGRAARWCCAAAPSTARSC